jgi:hypothetical protein
VNIQLGDTPAGRAPMYVVTGEARATRGTAPVAATIDSIVISYRVQNGEWLLDRKTSSFPVVDELPFMAQVDQQYSVRAVIYAHAASDTMTVRAQDEWVATARGIAVMSAHNSAGDERYHAVIQRRMRYRLTNSTPSSLRHTPST